MESELEKMVNNNLRMIVNLQDLVIRLAKALDSDYMAPASTEDSAVAPDSLAGSLKQQVNTP
jgi:hypothetical protein